MYFMFNFVRVGCDGMRLFVSGCTPSTSQSFPRISWPNTCSSSRIPRTRISTTILSHSKVVKDISLTIFSTLSYSKVVKDISLRKFSHRPSGHETSDVSDVCDVSDVSDVCYVCYVLNFPLQISPKIFCQNILTVPSWQEEQMFCQKIGHEISDILSYSKAGKEFVWQLLMVFTYIHLMSIYPIIVYKYTIRYRLKSLVERGLRRYLISRDLVWVYKWRKFIFRTRLVETYV